MIELRHQNIVSLLGLCIGTFVDSIHYRHRCIVSILLLSFLNSRQP
jgi:hypothetical protein